MTDNKENNRPPTEMRDAQTVNHIQQAVEVATFKKSLTASHIETALRPKPTPSTPPADPPTERPADNEK